MSQLLKNYLVYRNEPDIFVFSSKESRSNSSRMILPDISGIEITHTISDVNDVKCFLSTCPDEIQIQESSGVKVLTQQEWDNEIAEYDSRQSIKRWNLIRDYRNKLLDSTDWIVVKYSETNQNLSNEFKTWRQELRDFPTLSNFPTELPTLPPEITLDPSKSNKGSIESIYFNYFERLKSISMINDPI